MPVLLYDYRTWEEYLLSFL